MKLNDEFTIQTNISINDIQNILKNHIDNSKKQYFTYFNSNNYFRGRYDKKSFKLVYIKNNQNIYVQPIIYGEILNEEQEVFINVRIDIHGLTKALLFFLLPLIIIFLIFFNIDMMLKYVFFYKIFFSILIITAGFIIVKVISNDIEKCKGELVKIFKSVVIDKN